MNSIVSRAFTGAVIATGLCGVYSAYMQTQLLTTLRSATATFLRSVDDGPGTWRDKQVTATRDVAVHAVAAEREAKRAGELCAECVRLQHQFLELVDAAHPGGPDDTSARDEADARHHHRGD